MSPDGALVVFRIDHPPASGEPRGKTTGELFMVSAAGGEPVKIPDAGLNARSPRWSPDGRLLAWIATRVGHPGPQLHLRAATGGPVSVITAAAGGVATFAWSPDSTRIGFTARDAISAAQQQALDEGRDWIVFGSPAAQLRLYSVEIVSQITTLVTRAELSIHFFDWSPDGTRLVVAGAPTSGDDDGLLATQLYLVDAAGDVPKLIVPHAGRLSHVNWSGDGKWIAWLGSTHISDPWAGSVFVVPANAKGTPRNLMGDYPGTAVWLGALPGNPERLALVVEERQARVIRVLDLETGLMEPYSVAPPAVFIGAPSFSRDGGMFATVASTPFHPSEAYVGVPGSIRDLRRLTVTNAQLRDVALGAQEETRWTSKDGLSIEGVMIKPVGFRQGVRYPVVVHVHGGSENVVANGWMGSYIDWGQLLAARGYVVIYPNYRGSRGRGVDFVRGNRRDLMGREWEDIESALDHVVSLGIADQSRAGIYGFSWGGYAAGWGATYASKRFKAAVAGAGIFDWISEAGTNDTRMHEQLAHWDEPLYENFLSYLQRSPIYHIHRATTPLLMLHGAEDPSCPVSQAIEMHTARKWRGVPVQLVIYPREGHRLTEAPHQRDFVTRGLAWLDRYLKKDDLNPQPQPQATHLPRLNPDTISCRSGRRPQGRGQSSVDGDRPSRQRCTTGQ